MKVYVVKRIDGKYLSGYNNYDYRLENPCKPCWTEKLYNAKIFEEYEEADNFCNTIDCQIVECSFMETTELSDYTKQVRKEVVQEIRERIKDVVFLAHETELGERLNCISYYKMLDILLRIEQGETK